MEEKKLYPMKFCSLLDEYSWGSEEFELADLGYRDSLVREGWLAGNAMSEVMDTYMDRVVGDNVYAFWGRQFPVQVKHIKVSGRMPLRVHPDADTAVQRYDFLGREKLWYVLRAGKGAKLFLGFCRDTDAAEVIAGCADGSIASLMHAVEPSGGEFFHIRPGVPHAAEGDIELIEISESSPLDFCLSGWGGEVDAAEFDPSLNLTEALDFIDYRSWEQPGRPAAEDSAVAHKLIDIPEFTVSRLNLSMPLQISSERSDTFVLYTCVRGAAAVQIDVLGQRASFPFSAGQSMLVPAECPDFYLVPAAEGTVLLETGVAPREEKDGYTA